jgi:hypothetical protein
MRQIYISYDPIDEAFATQLTDDLTAYGANVWLDIRNARPGRHWSRSIEAALSDSNMMVVVLSPQALMSRHVAAEWQAYLEAYRPVIPALAEVCDPPGPLRTRRPVDFTRARLYNRALHELITRLIDYNTRVRRQEPVIWSPPTNEHVHDHSANATGGQDSTPRPRQTPPPGPISDASNLRRMVRGLRTYLER